MDGILLQGPCLVKGAQKWFVLFPSNNNLPIIKLRFMARLEVSMCHILISPQLSSSVPFHCFATFHGYINDTVHSIHCIPSHQRLSSPPLALMPADDLILISSSLCTTDTVQGV